MIVESPDALLRRLEQGHWFLKHRAKGDKPHKRFVYCDGPAIYWANREDRTGKVGCLKAVGELLVVPGLASAVLFGKVRLRDRQNRLFSVVSSARLGPRWPSLISRNTRPSNAMTGGWRQKGGAVNIGESSVPFDLGRDALPPPDERGEILPEPIVIARVIKVSR